MQTLYMIEQQESDGQWKAISCGLNRIKADYALHSLRCLAMDNNSYTQYRIKKCASINN